MCRYHVSSRESRDEEYLVIDLLPGKNSLYNHYCLSLVKSNIKPTTKWLKVYEEQYQKDFFGTFLQTKVRLQTILADAIKSGFEVEMTHLDMYFQ